MPAQPQEKNIDDLLSQQHGNDESRVQSELRKEQMKAKKQKAVSPVLHDPPQHEQSSDEQSGERKNTAEQSESQSQQPDEEKKEKKLRLLQTRKRWKAMEELKKLEAKLNKLKKLTDKYKSTNFLFLLLLAAFVDMAAVPITFFWGTGLLIPIALVLMLIKQMICLFIWIKIHKIKTIQKTDDGLLWTLIALAIESIPFISALPATIARVFKARNSARTKFKKRQTEIKRIQKKMNKINKTIELNI